MILYVDGDAFPNLLKTIVVKAINRLKLKCIVVANKQISLGRSDYIDYLIVGLNPDEADDKIVELIDIEDLVLTADIPLADRVIEKNAHAMDFRGKMFTKENIKEYLSIRNFMQEMRESGLNTPGPAPFSKKDVNLFANQFNNFLQKKLIT